MKVTEGSTAVLSPLFMEYYDADTEIENLKIVIDSNRQHSVGTMPVPSCVMWTFFNFA